MDAKGANLSAKANIYSLSMSWDNLHRYESQENIDEKVVEALEPHPNLESLEIIGFRGSGFPDWMIDGTVLENVTSIKIDWMKCSCLPPFGKLPRLESLRLRNGDAEYVEQDVHSTRRFPSLRILDIEGFPNLKGLVKKGGEENFSKLEEMEISYCPSFIFPTISSLKKLLVRGDTDATNLSSISNLTSLTSLSIDDNPAASLPEEMFKSLSNLKSLKIENFTKLKELPISLVSLTALTDLKIGNCDALECLPEQSLEGLTSLASLSVRNCKMLKSLPEGLQYLTALNSLEVVSCPEMVALPYGLHSLPSISFMGKDYFSSQTLESKLVELPQSLREACGLRDLRIGGFPGLVTLPDWLGDLTSLQSLKIFTCPQLQALPASIMRMKNLRELLILECEKLTKRCERGMGEDWQKIAHIPDVYVR